MLALVVGCGGRGEGEERENAAGPVEAPAAEVPVGDPCFVSSLEVRAEGEGDLIPAARVEDWLVEGLRAVGVQKGPGPGGGLQVVYLLTELSAGGGWSLGIKALWEIMDGPLRQPVTVDIARDLPADADLADVGAEIFDGLAATLAFRCRLSTVPSSSLAGLGEGLEGVDDLVAWARSCGDRGVVGCEARLTVLMGDQRSHVAAAALMALGQVGAEDAVAGIVARTVRADPLVVRAAVFALGELGTEESRRYLQLWSEGHPDPDVRALAAEMLELD